MKKNPLDRRLVNELLTLAKKERKIREIKRRIRLRGKVIEKGKTKKGNLKLLVLCEGNSYVVAIMKSQSDTVAIAERLKIGSYVSLEGINRFRAIICTKLKHIQSIDESRQTTIS